MNVWNICASISVTITHIWTKFGTEHKYRTINTPEWPNSHKLKIQDRGGRHLEFRKNVNNFGLDKDILHQIIWEDAPRLRGDDHVTKSPNRMLIRVTSSVKVWSKCASISVTITDIWTKFGTEHKYHTTNTQEWPNSHKIKIQDNGGRHLQFRKMSITFYWIKISCIKLYEKMHHGDEGMTMGPKVETGS